MKFAIISDSHDNWPNILTALKFIEKRGIDLIIHCGDISSGEVLRQTGKNFKGKIHAVLGNVSSSLETMQKKAKSVGSITIYEETGELKIDNKKIAWNHYPDQAKELAESGKYDLVFYGHDHKPWEKQLGKTTLLNPGTLAGLFNKPSFAIYDTKTDRAELVLLEKL